MVRRYKWHSQHRDHIAEDGIGCSAVEIVGADDYDAAIALLHRTEDEKTALKARLNAEENAHAELQARCFDQGSQSVFDAVREARARLAEAEQFLRARVSASGVQK